MPAAFSSSSVLPTEATSGIGVDDVGDDVVVHVAGLAGDDLGDGDAFVLGLVRQHRAGDHVADGVDAGDVGREMRVDDDAAAVVELRRRPPRARGLRCKGTRPIATSTTSASIVSAAPPAAGSTLTFSASPAASTPVTLDAELERDALLLQHALELPRDLAVHAGQDAVEELDHRHLARRAGARPSRARGR